MEFWSAILGLVMTLFTELLKKRSWPTAVKALMAVGVSVFFGVVQGLVLGTFTLQTILQNITIIFATGEALYGLYFKNMFEVRSGEQ